VNGFVLVEYGVVGKVTTGALGPELSCVITTVLVALTSVVDATSAATTARVFTLLGVRLTVADQFPPAVVVAYAALTPPVMVMVVLALAVPSKMIGLVVVDWLGVVITGAEGVAANAFVPMKTAKRSAKPATKAAPFFMFRVIMFIAVY